MVNLSWCIWDIQLRFRYQTGTSGCMRWILLSLIYMSRRQPLTEVPLQDWLAIHSPGVMAMIWFRRDWLLPAMQARISWDPPACINPSMLVGSSSLLSTLRSPGSRAQVSNGNMETLTTISSSHMKKFQAATREDICPSLPIATMISPWAIMSSRWSTPTSTLG